MKRPLAVTIIGWFFIAAGTVGFIYHITEVDIQNYFANDALWVLFIRLLAIACGILILLGVSLGRWLLTAWLLYHIVLSYFHTISELITHAVFLAIVAYILFHKKVAAFFRRV